MYTNVYKYIQIYIVAFTYTTPEKSSDNRFANKDCSVKLYKLTS